MHDKLEIEMNVFKCQEQLHFYTVFIIWDVYFSGIANITCDHNPVAGLRVPKCFATISETTEPIYLKKAVPQWKIQTNARTWILDKWMYNCIINTYIKLMFIYIDINLFAIIEKLIDLPDLHDLFNPLSSS